MIQIFTLLLAVPASFGLVKYPRRYVEPQFLDALRATGQWREFGKLLGIEDISLIQPGRSGIMDDPMRNKGLQYGDVISTPDHLQESYSGINKTKYGGNKWKDNVVPYYISSVDYNYEQRKIIKDAIDNFNNKVDSIKLRPRRLERDYVMVFSGNGCYSHLGRVGGQQALSLRAANCLSQFIVHHEFMHAIGLIHEQNREDRDSYIEILPENIPEEYLVQYRKREKNLNDFDWTLAGPYDFYSVMHYPIKVALTKKPAFRILREGINETRIGRGDGVTSLDIEKLNYYYNRNRSISDSSKKLPPDYGF